MDELSRAQQAARRGLIFATLVPVVLFSAMAGAYYVWLFFFADFSGFG